MENGGPPREVNQRLDRIDTTVINHGRQLVARVISGFNQSLRKADADCTRGLADQPRNILTTYIRCVTIQSWPTESSSIGMP